LEKLRGPAKELEGPAMLLTLDDSREERYKLDDRKRKIAQDLNQLTSGKRLERLRNDYQKAQEEVTTIVNNSGNDQERRQLREVIGREHTFLSSANPQKLEAEIDQLRVIEWQILRRTPQFLVDWFKYLVERREMFNDQLQAKSLIEAGNKHIEAQDYDKLADVNGRLRSLLPQPGKVSKEMRYFAGILG